MYCYNYEYADLPMRLSPIYEEDEDRLEETGHQSVATVSAGGVCSEANNSSHVVAAEKSGCRSVETGNENIRGQQIGQQQYNLDKKPGYIESHSGRRHDVTEVLKQKYINNDIQDLPRFEPGPLRYGRLHRSRTSRVNLASMDIRAQMNKIRIHNMETAFKEGKHEYRCGKYASYINVDKLKSLQQMLQDDYSTIDEEYDHEVAAICESCSGELLEGCGLMSREGIDMIPRDDLSCDLGHDDLLSDSMVERRFHDYEVDKETKLAFWKGFVEGMRRTKTQQSNETDLLNETIENKELLKEVTKDPCLEIDSHKMIIDNNQDVTHKSLRDWEQSLRVERNTALPPMDRHDSPSSSTSKLCKIPEVDNVMPAKDTSELHQTKCTSMKVTQRRTLPLARMDIDLPVNSNHRQRDLKVIVSSDDNSATGLDEKNPHLNPRRDRKVANDVTVEEQKRRREKIIKGPPRDMPASDREQHTRTKPPMRSLTTDVDDELNIVKIAKKRLESRTFSSLNFEQICRQSSESNTPDKCSSQPEEMSAAYRDSQTMKMEDLNGWTTKLKLYSDNLDNIKLSTSELLHPVDSAETVYGARDTPGSPRKSVDPTSVKSNPSNVSPIESPICLKMRKRGNTVSKLTISPDPRIRTPDRCTSTSARGTPTNASIYDLRERTSGKTEYETKAFKPTRGNIAPFTEITRSFSDCKPKPRVSTMRLTKSMNDFSSTYDIYKRNNYRNTPTLRCQNYNTEKQLMSKITANINLSETLAKQLKNIGKDRAKCLDNTTDHRNQLNRGLMMSPDREPTSSLLHVSELPAIGGRGLFSQELQNEDRCPDNSSIFTLPRIHQQDSKSFTNRSYMQSTINEQDVSDQRPKSVELPPIGVRSLLNVVSPSTAGNRDVDMDTWPRSIPVRIEVCTSPYMFDKANPKKLQIAARPLTNMHSVCTSCGSISEKPENTSGHERNNKRILKLQGNSQNIQKTSSHQCIDQAANYAKWHLEGDSPFFDRNIPEISPAKLSQQIQKKTLRKQKERIQEIKSNNKSSQKKSKKHEELSFQFIDQNIKVKFECEISLKHDAKYDKHARRIDSLAAHASRDKMKCPMAKETRIYKETRKGKKLRKSQTEDMTSLSDRNSPSPYVEYCKRKAKMRCLKSERYKDEYLNMLSDTGMPDEDKKDEHVRRKMPIIPQKSEEKLRKAKERRKLASNVENCESPRQEYLNHLCVTSEPPPLLKTRGSTKTVVKIPIETEVTDYEEAPATNEPMDTDNGIHYSTDSAVKLSVEIEA